MTVITNRELVREIGRLHYQGKTASAIAKLVHKRKQNVLDTVRAITGKEKKPAARKYVPKKYKLKIYAYRDFILDEEEKSYGHGCNLYFFMKNPGTREFDWMSEVREFFIVEIDHSGFGASGMTYQKSEISIADPDEISIPVEDRNTEQFVFEIGMLGSETFQYYGHFVHAWKLFFAWEGFNKQNLEKLLRKKK